jgi:hypothetical protein
MNIGLWFIGTTPLVIDIIALIVTFALKWIDKQPLKGTLSPVAGLFRKRLAAKKRETFTWYKDRTDEELDVDVSKPYLMFIFVSAVSIMVMVIVDMCIKFAFIPTLIIFGTIISIVALMWILRALRSLWKTVVAMAKFAHKHSDGSDEKVKIDTSI